MADGVNKVMLLGTLGADPEIRVLPSGDSILSIRMATNESFLDRNKERQERTEWHKVTMWGKRGEALARFLEKGSKIFVEGSLKTTSYEKNSEKRYSTEINASNIVLCGKSRSNQGPSDGTEHDDPVKVGGTRSRGKQLDTPPEDDDLPF
jgi:single-strand DNA-binding protein